MRWPIETCFEEGKQFLGMGDYEVRSFTGWHHHMTFVMLADHFLEPKQCRLQEKTPFLTLPQAQFLLTCVLPAPLTHLESVLCVLKYRQQRKGAAYLSHRRRRVRYLTELFNLS